jgi:hypothetical protein
MSERVDVYVHQVKPERSKVDRALDFGAVGLALWAVWELVRP